MKLRAFFKLILGTTWLVMVLALASCADSEEGSAFQPGKNFPPDHETQVDLVQVVMSALPGVHMGPVRQALTDQKAKMYLGKSIEKLCAYERAEDDEGLRQEVLSGPGCPLRIEVENFGQTLDFENGIVRFQENVLYVRQASPHRRRQGLEVHSRFEFHLDFSAPEVIPTKIFVIARAKHLRRGELNLESEMSFSGNGGDDKFLRAKISNALYSSVIEIDFAKNILRVDGVESRAFQDPRARLYTSPPDLTQSR